MTPDEVQQAVMTMIAGAGEAKRLCYTALEAAGRGAVLDAREMIREAEQALQKVHEAHFGFLTGAGLPQDPQMALLVMHAEDILMSTMTEKELIKRLLDANIFPTRPQEA